MANETLTGSSESRSDSPRAVRAPRGIGRARSARAGLTLLALILAVASVLPVLYMVSASFKTRDTVTDGKLLPSEFTFDNYRYVFTEVPFTRYLLNSFLISAVITVVALLFHSMAAYALARLRFPGREKLFALIFSTLLVTAPVVLIPLFLVARELNLLDSYAGLIIPAIFNAFGIFLLRQFYLGLPRELEEAAIVDGCGHWRVYWSIVLPMSRPILSALAVFFFLANWNAFVWPLVATNDPDLTVVQLGISTLQNQYTSNWNYILAAATVAALPMLALFFAFQRQIVESIKTSGIK
ncbi:transport system inner membrane protein [Streptomyces albus]|uniref:Transport system inner membrane protein n=1 Tax=Streptomyces albus (strain ATCC 21838 / DSM 41398 / FERM P-419 / JCM 4703 / NBRC 107858) TaxID=1081613 RepID=A0A0B5F7U5_STRA4|nr:transport system inner membrane protein [Streptomyces albus]AOU80846.1 transport system inner membrane protein [Streptomyces albus]AYN36549.1 carbohydrate ABC transporter permease [Streptomyces albus]